MNRAATIALAPFSALYSAAVKARSAGYESRFLKSHKVAAPVISVGNITVGGTGKTPLVDWLARHLADSHRKVCILSRGYRRENGKQQIVVSDGEQVLADVAQSGDEAMMLARSLLGSCAVVCDADRASAAAWAIDHLKSDLLLLDDGFQHRALARDFDLVTLDATNPFGNGRLLPSGILREPINSLNRADSIVITRTSDTNAAELIDRIRQVTDAPIFQSQTTIAQIRRLDPTDGENDFADTNQALAAFCGIGNPDAFFHQLRAKRFDVRYWASFRDHHKYSQADIDRVTEHAKAKGAKALITTEKDSVKLQSLHFEHPCYVVQIKIEIADGTKLLELIEQAIAAKEN